MTSAHQPPVDLSVIIPTRNRSGLLEECVESLVEQDTDKSYEIVVVDDGSTDDTAERIRNVLHRHGRRVRYVSQAPSGLNAARNAGMRNTEAPILAFLDDDVLAPETYVDAVIRGVSDNPEVDCFGGRIRLRLEGQPPRWCGREPIGETELEEGDSDRLIENAWGANLILRRRAFTKVGPFVEEMSLYGDEVEWQSRIKREGGRVMYLADACVWHRRTGEELTLKALTRRNFRKGLSYPQMRILMHQHVSPWGGIRHVVIGLGHALRYRCWIGFVRAAMGAGHALSATRLLLSRQKSAYLHWIPARRRQ